MLGVALVHHRATSDRCEIKLTELGYAKRLGRFLTIAETVSTYNKTWPEKNLGHSKYGSDYTFSNSN